MVNTGSVSGASSAAEASRPLLADDPSLSMDELRGGSTTSVGEDGPESYELQSMSDEQDDHRRMPGSTRLEEKERGGSCE